MSGIEVARANTANGTTTLTSFGAAVSVAVPVGRTLLVAVNAPVNVAAQTFTVTDSKSNTYTARGHEATTPVNWQVWVFECVVTTALTTSDTITAHASGAGAVKWQIQADSFDDLVTSSGFDVGTTNTATATTSLSSGTTAAAAQNSELVYAAFAFTSNPTFTAETSPTTFSSPGIDTVSSASAPRSLAVEWAYVNASGTRNATATLGSSQPYGAVIVAYKRAGSAPVSNAGTDQTAIEPYSVVTLDGSGSTFSTPDTAVTYLWTPPSGVTLSSNTAQNPTFTVPGNLSDTNYTFSLTVKGNVSGLSSTSDSVLIAALASTEAWVNSSGVWKPGHFIAQ